MSGVFKRGPRRRGVIGSGAVLALLFVAGIPDGRHGSLAAARAEERTSAAMGSIDAAPSAGAVAASLSPGDVALGHWTLPGAGVDGPVDVMFPSDDKRRPRQGNRRLVVISHGSGGWYGVHLDLARALVEAGYVVAFPTHRGDNRDDPGDAGPDSWKRRPIEVSHAIDSVAADARLAPLLDLDRVGMYGMSAGGHTALSLAGGGWSPALFRQHCDQDLVDDFQSCVGLIMQLTGGPFDGLKRWLARLAIDSRFGDDTVHTHTDSRIVAIAAAVPAAADFDMSTLAHPVVPLALLTAGRDAWLVPRFHSDQVLAACLPRCEHLVDLPTAGHGAYLSPLPPHLDGLIGRMLNDPPGFDRSMLVQVDRKLVGFFDRTLRPDVSRVR